MLIIIVGRVSQSRKSALSLLNASLKPAKEVTMPSGERLGALEKVVIDLLNGVHESAHGLVMTNYVVTCRFI